MYSLRSKTSPFPCNVAVTLWIPCTPTFLPAAASATLRRAFPPFPRSPPRRPRALLGYRQLNGLRREPPPQEEPPEPEADPLPRAPNREMARREELPPQAGQASFASSGRRMYASNTFRHDSHP